MRIITFILTIIPFFISSFIYRYDSIYYESLNKPFFIMSNSMFSIIWIIMFIILSISISYCFLKNSKNKDFLYIVLSNYLSIYLYLVTFFNLKSPIFASIMALSVLVSSLFLLKETKKINNKSSLLIIPYIIFNTYLTILSFTVCFMNL